MVNGIGAPIATKIAAKAENNAVIRAVPLAKKYWEYTKVAEIMKDAQNQSIPTRCWLTKSANTATTPSLPSKPAIPTSVPIQIRISQPVRSPRISSHVRDPVTTQASTPIIATTVGCNFVQIAVDHSKIQSTKIIATEISAFVIGPSISSSFWAITAAWGVSLISGG